MTKQYVAADPYPWPYNGDLRPAQYRRSIVIDMQTDFCGDRRLCRPDGVRSEPDARTDRADRNATARCRCAVWVFTSFHTREGHRPDLRIAGE